MEPLQIQMKTCQCKYTRFVDNPQDQPKAQLNAICGEAHNFFASYVSENSPKSPLTKGRLQGG